MERILDNLEEILDQADAKQKPRTYSHIPDWAVAVFAACAFLCLLMAVGLCLMRSSVRRGSPRGKAVGTSRRWKAGFVGESLDGNPTGGVNLMQMMLPPSRYAS